MSNLLVINLFIPIIIVVFVYLDSRKLKDKGIPVNPYIATVLVLIFAYFLPIFLPLALRLSTDEAPSITFLSELISYIILISTYLLFRHFRYKRLPDLSVKSTPITKKKSKWLLALILFILFIFMMIIFAVPGCAPIFYRQNSAPPLCRTLNFLETFFEDYILGGSFFGF